MDSENSKWLFPEEIVEWQVCKDYGLPTPIIVNALIQARKMLAKHQFPKTGRSCIECGMSNYHYPDCALNKLLPPLSKI